MAKLLSSFLNTSFSTFDSNEVIALISAGSTTVLGTGTSGDYIESALAGSGIIITNSSTPEGANLTFAIDSSVVVALTKTQTLTNKTFNLTNNTLVGNAAEFNTALSGDNFVTETASQTITNKTLTAPIIGSSGASFTGSASGAINVLATSIAGSNTITLPAVTGTLVTEANTATLTNKTISGANNTLSNIPNTATTADSANTANAIVTRNASGNFSAGTITATLSGTLATSRNLWGQSFNGGANVTGNLTSVGNITGTGSLDIAATGANRVTITTNSVERMRVDSSGNLQFSGTGQRILGDFSNATETSRLLAQTTTVNGNTFFGVIPNGTATTASLNIHNNSDPTNAGRLTSVINSTETSIRSAINGTGTYLPMTFYTSGSERLRVDINGNVGIGGSVPASNPKLSMYGGIRFLANETAAATYTGIGSIASDTVCVSTSGSERMRIDASGNVGIGVTPTTKLDVNGTITATGYAGTVDGTNKVGYRNIPAVGTKTSSYTLAVGDVGKYVQLGTSGSIIIPNATFAEGDAITVFNNTAAAITITCTITTAYISGTDTDKATVSLATRGIANIFFISGTVCVITGNVT